MAETEKKPGREFHVGWPVVPTVLWLIVLIVLISIILKSAVGTK